VTYAELSLPNSPAYPNHHQQLAHGCPSGTGSLMPRHPHAGHGSPMMIRGPNNETVIYAQIDPLQTALASVQEQHTQTGPGPTYNNSGTGMVPCSSSSVGCPQLPSSEVRIPPPPPEDCICQNGTIDNPQHSNNGVRPNNSNLASTFFYPRCTNNTVAQNIIIFNMTY